MSVMAAAEQERRDLAELLSTLSPEQWDAPTLCAQWRVRDVVAHIVSYEVASPRAIATRAVRGRLVLSRMNRTGVAELRERPPAELLRLLRDNLQPRGLSTAFGGRVALIDALIHHQDIRRPLRLPRVVPAERLRMVMPFAMVAPPIRGLWHARGVRVVATDLDWATGRGPEARGTGEAVLLGLAGRRSVAAELTGPGAARLVARLG